MPAWLWMAFAGFMLPALAFGARPDAAGTAMAAAATCIVVVHAVCALGSRQAWVFLVVCLTVTFGMENLGVLTGFPFGRYHFVVGAGLPHVGAIPLIVGFLYLGMGYPSWAIAGVLLGRAGLEPTRISARWRCRWWPASCSCSGTWSWTRARPRWAAPGCGTRGAATSACRPATSPAGC